MEQKQFNRNIVTIKKNGKAMDKLIHESACYALEQVSKHGNNTFCNLLLSAVGKNVRKEAIITWFKAFGKVKMDKEGLLQSASKKPLVFEGKEVTIEEALELAVSIPFYDFSKEVVKEIHYNVLDSVASLVARMRNAAKAGKHVDNMELLPQLEAMLPATV